MLLDEREVLKLQLLVSTVARLGTHIWLAFAGQEVRVPAASVGRSPFLIVGSKGLRL